MCVAYGFRLACADFLQRQLAQNVVTALGVRARSMTHSCDRLPDIVVAVADAQSDTDRFERKAHHADRLVVELFAVEQGPKGMITRRRDVIARHAAGTFDTRLFEARKSPGGPGLRTF